MKHIIIIISLLISAVAFAKTKKEKIMVKGNCGECKERIEEAVYTLPGVKKAVWNKKSKFLELVYNDEKTTIEKIEEVILGVGHDTKDKKAADSIYKTLPACCAFRDGKCNEE